MNVFSWIFDVEKLAVARLVDAFRFLDLYPTRAYTECIGLY